MHPDVYKLEALFSPVKDRIMLAHARRIKMLVERDPFRDLEVDVDLPVETDTQQRTDSDAYEQQ